jgi:hypothetical protein
MAEWIADGELALPQPQVVGSHQRDRLGGGKGASQSDYRHFVIGRTTEMGGVEGFTAVEADLDTTDTIVDDKETGLPV